MKKLFFLIILVVFAAGCSSTKNKASENPDSDTTGKDDADQTIKDSDGSDADELIPDTDSKELCENLSVELCGKRADCALISGQLINETEMCIENTGFFGCKNNPFPCDSVITQAEGIDGKCYQFFDGCIPKGWKYAEEGSRCRAGYIDEHCDKVGLPCEKLDVQSCPANDKCAVISGKKIRMADKCYEETTGYDCHEAASECLEMETRALDSKGNCYEFPTACIPLTFSIAPDDSECSFVKTENIDNCPNPITNPCGKLTPEECGKRSDCSVISGKKVNTAENCTEELEELGCKPLETGCGEAETLASDESGACYLFSTTCIPDKFSTDTEGCDWDSVGSVTDCL